MKTEPTDITVTTATGTEASLRKEMGVEETPAAAVVEKPVEKKAPEADAAAEADSAKPDAELSEAGRTLRRNRADQRKQQIQNDIDALVKKRSEERTAFEREEQERAERRRTAEPVAKPAVAEKPAAAGAEPAFEFPSWDKYQETHPDAEFTDYVDARTDARSAFNDQKRDAAAAAKAEEDRKTRELADRRSRQQKAVAAVDTFKQTHADYDTVVAATPLKEGVDFVVNAKNERVFSKQFIDVQENLTESGEDAPAVLYHLAKNPNDLRALLDAPNAKTLDRLYGRIEAAAIAAASAGAEKPAAEAPARAKTVPAKPVTSAPVPVSEPQGSAQRNRSLQQLADDGDDADPYIEERQKQLGRRR